MEQLNGVSKGGGASPLVYVNLGRGQYLGREAASFMSVGVPVCFMNASMLINTRRIDGEPRYSQPPSLRGGFWLWSPELLRINSRKSRSDFQRRCPRSERNSSRLARWSIDL